MKQASVIVRALNKSATIEATLSELRQQTVPVELIVVDSGSSDGTVDIARKYADKLIQIPPEAFSYGGALNLGAQAASAPFHFAVSAHRGPGDPAWVEKCLRHYDREDVAAVNGNQYDTYARPISAPFYQTAEAVGRDAYWGYSNTTASWRASVWRRFAFREDMVACEDKEWSWRVLSAGYSIVYDPAIVVPSTHRRAAGAKELYMRLYREGFAIASVGALPSPTLASLMREWWSDFPHPSTKPRWLRRFGHYRLVELIGRHMGERAGAAAVREVGAAPWPPRSPSLAQPGHQPGRTAVDATPLAHD
jgi:rhamnosyltransferase